jgi:hypothetical protein
MCLPYTTRKPENPSWNYVLLHATPPESSQLVLDHGVIRTSQASARTRRCTT